MTDPGSENTAVLPPVEGAGTVNETVAAAPATQSAPVPPPAAGATDASKVMIVIAAVVLGFVVLSGTFASGVFVGAHFGGGRPAAFAGQGRIGGPGVGMDRRDGPGMMQRRGGQFRGRGGNGQGGPQNFNGSQAPTAPGLPGGQR